MKEFSVSCETYIGVLCMHIYTNNKYSAERIFKREIVKLHSIAMSELGDCKVIRC